MLYYKSPMKYFLFFFTLLSPSYVVAEDVSPELQAVFDKYGFENVDNPNVMKEKPLSRVARENDLESVKILVENGADVNAASIIGWTALKWAAQLGNLDMVNYLISKGANVNEAGAIGTPLYYASEYDNLPVIKSLVEAGAEINIRIPFEYKRGGYTPLHRATEEGHLEIANYLIDQGADVNAKDKYGRTPSKLAPKKSS